MSTKRPMATMFRTLLLVVVAGSSSVAAFTAPGAMQLRLAASRGPAISQRASCVRMMALPSGWKQVKDPASGDFYYFNQATGVTQWEAPTAAPASSKPAAGGPELTKFDVSCFFFPANGK
jgi:H+/gluconate symporter-like permease